VIQCFIDCIHPQVDKVVPHSANLPVTGMTGVNQALPRGGLHSLAPPARGQGQCPHHLNPCTPPLNQNDPWPPMSSTVQATSSISPSSNFQLITDALADYTRITGIVISEHPFAAAIEQANSPGDILELLQERENAFKDYRERNRKLISCISPAVNVIQAFSGVLGEAVSLVSLTLHLVTFLTGPCQVPLPPAKAAKAFFVGIDVLLSVRPFNALSNHFPCDI
jgi:hypothetical protein